LIVAGVSREAVAARSVTIAQDARASGAAVWVIGPPYRTLAGSWAVWLDIAGDMAFGTGERVTLPEHFTEVARPARGRRR